MTDQTDDQKIREAMSLLGKRTSERKTNASRLNIAYASSCRVLKPCSCGAFPHRQPCPVYRREAQQRNRARQSAI